MKQCLSIHVLVSLAVAVVLAAPPPIYSKDKQDIEGSWLGAISLQGMELRVLFNITTDSSGVLTATMGSPDQGVAGIPVEDVTLEQRHLRLHVMSAAGIFEGDVSEDGSSIEGEWRQAGMKFPLILTRSDGVPVMSRPQEPKPPFPYSEEEVTYLNEADDVTLAGTLTVPDSEGPFPAALLISGSGSQDRDETILGHKPFLVLADYLTRNGIAVLRVDDRGVGGSSLGTGEPTSEDFAGDVEAGVRFLLNRDDIDHKKIGLIGHSEGGVIAPMVAAKSGDIAFIVMMAGPGLPGEDVLYRQSELINRAEGMSEELIDFSRDMQQRVFALLKKEPDDSVLQAELDKIKLETMETLTDEQRQDSTLWENTIEMQIRMAATPWFRFFLTYDPRPVLKKVKCPVLAVIGEKDLQVPATENLEAIKKALDEGGNSDHKELELPRLNHLFQVAETGSPVEYGKIEETMSPEALKLIADWIVERVR